MFSSASLLSILAGTLILANAEPISFRRQTAANPFGNVPSSCTGSCQPLIDAYNPCFNSGQADPTCFCTNANLGKAAACAQCLVNVGFASESDEQQALGFIAQACAAEGVSTPTLAAGSAPTGSASSSASSAPSDTATSSGSSIEVTSSTESSTSITSSSTSSTATAPAANSTGSTGSSSSGSSSSKSSTSSSSAPAATTSSSGATTVVVGTWVLIGAPVIGFLGAMF